MESLTYSNLGYSFEFTVDAITGVIGSEKLLLAGAQLVEQPDVHLPGLRIGVIDEGFTQKEKQSLGDLLSHEFKVHKKVSRKRSLQAASEILQFLDADDIVNVPIHSLDEEQFAHARLARAIALRPEIVISSNYLSAMSAPVRSKILRNISDIHAELQVGFLLLEKRAVVVEHIASKVFNFHPVVAPVERVNVSVEPRTPSPVKSSPDEISGLDFVSS
jgi:ABC-type glutathione transport system ATPase component